MTSRGSNGDAAAAAVATAQPPARPTLEVGSHIEVRMEQGQPCWAELEVLEAHGGHVYTLLADLAAMEGDETAGEDLVWDNAEQAAEGGQEDDEAAVEEAGQEQQDSPAAASGAAAAAAGASAGDGGSSAGDEAGGGSAAAAAAAEARAARLQHVKARVVSESALVFQWANSGETTHEWRPAAANLQVMFERGFEKMAEMASVPQALKPTCRWDPWLLLPPPAWRTFSGAPLNVQRQRAQGRSALIWCTQ